MKPVHKNIAIMCCGCNRLMGADGKPVGMMSFDQDRHPLGLTSHVSTADIAWYSTNEKSDTAAIAFGWRAENGNHRCPDCVKSEKYRQNQPYPGVVEHHGAYIDRSQLVSHAQSSNGRGARTSPNPKKKEHS